MLHEFLKKEGIEATETNIQKLCTLHKLKTPEDLMYQIGQKVFTLGDLEKNELIVVQGHDHPLLQSRSLRMHDLSFTLPTRPQEGVYTCKTRYRMQDAVCELHYIDDENIELRFKEPQWAVTPGQSAVLYDGDVCLGGGVITSRA